MRKAAIEKTHIFIIMFFMSLVMSIQAPIFAPYAAKLGASSVLIGMMLSIASFTNLTGNLLAGPLVDRFGKKVFITVPILVSGTLFIAHALASNSTSLLILRALNGFSLAFLIPAALALLSSYAKNSQQQGKNMAINGILGTIASIIAPLIGGLLGTAIGYANTYYIIGISLILIGFYTVKTIIEKENIISVDAQAKPLSFIQVIQNPLLKVVFLTGFALMYIHGVIIYEVPYLAVEQGLSTAVTGVLFSFFGVGTFFSLSLFFIHRFSPIKRLIFGLFGMCFSLFLLINSLLALPFLLFCLGFFFGIMMPAMATAVTDAISNEGHGRAFGVMSAVYSAGMISSSFITGIIRDVVSPYFIAFLIGMIALTIIGYSRLQSGAISISKKQYHY
ncbi:MFS transporter [Ornithinibacillus halotolerans]|uniref:MFS transporter n=1 Tax=Ornithinibacillus halotolerans TaxID=1274357 RepID=A0A916W6X1_9BACI|nr:MFS transporter [Ornithinibacillus halotolerans]GGA71443.1 MFS transporter [Ornithinibacillus halotolerans]